MYYFNKINEGVKLLFCNMFIIYNFSPLLYTEVISRFIIIWFKWFMYCSSMSQFIKRYSVLQSVNVFDISNDNFLNYDNNSGSLIFSFTKLCNSSAVGLVMSYTMPFWIFKTSWNMMLFFTCKPRTNCTADLWRSVIAD